MSFWRKRRVFLTGHTGFKGSWLALWLQELGAEICGVALSASQEPNLFAEAGVAHGMRSEIADIRDLERLQALVREFKPEIVFHLAAQPLVRASYEDPIGTFTTNVIGTANMLESIRTCESVRSVVVITSDKCYENHEWEWGYRENDRLGGYDPYSSSKACAELVVASWRRSYFSGPGPCVAVASARAGNVIGGGDWSADRLIPDAVRAFVAGEALVLRNPAATRPWQHVLEPLRGYLMLAERLYEAGAAFCEAWNFGPDYRDVRTVGWVVRELAALWGDVADWRVAGEGQPHEARLLKLDWSKAASRLEWAPALPLEDAIRWTVEWYKAWSMNKDMRAVTTDQIRQYMQQAQYGQAIAVAVSATGGPR